MQYYSQIKELISIFLFCLIIEQSFGQTQHKVSAYLQGQYNKTIHDRTIGNNPWGMGLGFQLFLNTNVKFRPIVEITADVYLEDDKVLRVNPDGTPIDDLGSMINFLTGTSYSLSQTTYLSFEAGPALIEGQTLLGVKPSFGFCFSKKQRWTGRVSYINVFNRDKTTKEDFGSVSLLLGVKLL